MRKCDSPLDHLTVAAPCNVGWDNMVGSERVRFCGQCSLNVYNLSAMSKGEAERLVSQTEGRLCVRYYRRADGTILTKNCPIGLRALKRRLSRIASASISAVLSFFAGILAVTGLHERAQFPAMQIPAATQGAIEPTEKLPERSLFMGKYTAPEQSMGKVFLGEAGPTEHWEDGEIAVAGQLVRRTPKRK
jgi:hypothetical protein